MSDLSRAAGTREHATDALDASMQAPPSSPPLTQHHRLPSTTSGTIRARRLTPPKRFSLQPAQAQSLLPVAESAQAAAASAALVASSSSSSVADVPSQPSLSSSTVLLSPSLDGVPPDSVVVAVADDDGGRKTSSAAAAASSMPVLVAPHPSLPIVVSAVSAARSDEPASASAPASATTMMDVASSAPPKSSIDLVSADLPERAEGTFSPDLSRHFPSLRAASTAHTPSPSPPLPDLLAAAAAGELSSMPLSMLGLGKLSLSGLPSPSPSCSVSSSSASRSASGAGSGASSTFGSGHFGPVGSRPHLMHLSAPSTSSSSTYSSAPLSLVSSAPSSSASSSSSAAPLSASSAASSASSSLRSLPKSASSLMMPLPLSARLASSPASGDDGDINDSSVLLAASSDGHVRPPSSLSSSRARHGQARFNSHQAQQQELLLRQIEEQLRIQTQQSQIHATGATSSSDGASEVSVLAHTCAANATPTAGVVSRPDSPAAAVGSAPGSISPDRDGMSADNGNVLLDEALLHGQITERDLTQQQQEQEHGQGSQRQEKHPSPMEVALATLSPSPEPDQDGDDLQRAALAADSLASASGTLSSATSDAAASSAEVTIRKHRPNPSAFTFHAAVPPTATPSPDPAAATVVAAPESSADVATADAIVPSSAGMLSPPDPVTSAAGPTVVSSVVLVAPVPVLAVAASVILPLLSTPDSSRSADTSSGPVSSASSAGSGPRGSPSSTTSLSGTPGRTAGAPPFPLAGIKVNEVEEQAAPLQGEADAAASAALSSAGSSSSSSSRRSSTASRRASVAGMSQRPQGSSSQQSSRRASSVDDSLVPLYAASLAAAAAALAAEEELQLQQQQQLLQQEQACAPSCSPIGVTHTGAAAGCSRHPRRLSRSGSQIAADDAAAAATAAAMSPEHQLFASGTSMPSHPTVVLSRVERRALYASTAPSSVRFVSSYATATSGCMRPAQLSARDPALIGKLLHYFVGQFLATYGRGVLALVAGLLAVHYAGASHTVYAWAPLVLLLLLVWKLVQVHSFLTVELSPNTPLRNYQFFKHARLLARAKSLPVARLYGSSQLHAPHHHQSGTLLGCCATPATPSTPGTPIVFAVSTPSGAVYGGGSNTPASAATPQQQQQSAAAAQAAIATLASDILFQPSEGYCGQAALNNVLGSLPLLPSVSPPLRGRFFVSLPEVVRPFSLTAMQAYIQLVVASSPGVLAEAVENVELFDAWDGRAWGTTHQHPQQSSADEGESYDGSPAAASSSSSNIAASSGVESSSSLSSEQNYAAFLSLLTNQLNDPRYRFMINFLRTPLFFCEEENTAGGSTSNRVPPTPGGVPMRPKRAGSSSALSSLASPSPSFSSSLVPASPQHSAAATPMSCANVSSTASSAPATSNTSSGLPPVNLGRKLFSGHWSPLLGYLEPQEVERILYRGSATPQQQQQQGSAGGSSFYSYPPSPSLAGLTGSPQRPLGSLARERSGGGGGALPPHMLLTPSSDGPTGSPYFKPASPISEAEASHSQGSGPSQTEVLPPAFQLDEGDTGAETKLSPPLRPLTSGANAAGSVDSATAPGLKQIVDSASGAAASSSASGAAAASESSDIPGALPYYTRARSTPSAPSSSPSTAPPLHHQRRSHSDVAVTAAQVASSLAAGGVGNSGVVQNVGGNSNVVAAALASPWGAPATHYNYPATPRGIHAQQQQQQAGSVHAHMHNAERLALADGLCLVADVNPSYAHFLCPPRRLFDALTTRNVLNGEPRGLIRITLRQPQTQPLPQPQQSPQPRQSDQPSL